MTINEVAQRFGVSHQAVYKRIKANGLKLETLKDKKTGQLTPEGEAAVLDLFPQNEAPPPVATEVERLTTEVEKLRNQVESLDNQLKIITEERDFLRTTLEHSQQLQAATLAKLPTPQLLPSGEGNRFRRAWAIIRGKEGK